eukprot:TsM_000342600 transcript=TsM_000342600 gene=TsM_000342600
MWLPLTPSNYNTRSQSNPVFLRLLEFALCLAYSVAVSDSKTTWKSELNLIEIPNILESESVVDAKEEGKIDEKQVVLVPDGWHHFRRRIIGAIRRVGDGIRRLLESLEVYALVKIHIIAKEQFC